MLCSVEELAALAKLSARRIRQIDKELGEEDKLLKKEGTQYDGIHFVQAWVKYKVGDKAIDIRLDSARTEHEEIKAQTARLKLEQMQGNLVRRDDVLQIFGDVAARLKVRLLALPSKVAKSLTNQSDPNIIKAALTKEVREAMDEFTSAEAIEQLREGYEADADQE